MCRRDKDIVHIYFGASGTAASYLQSISRVLEKKYEQKSIVGFHNRGLGKHFIKLAFPLTDLAASPFLKGRLRLYVRYIELVFALILSVALMLLYRPRVVNYSLSMNLRIEAVFIELVKRVINPRMVVTLHDAVPEKNIHRSDTARDATRRRILKSADFILCHNDFSASLAAEIYGGGKVLKHPFPPMFVKENHNNEVIKRQEASILFLGNLRVEKGVSNLIEAWKNHKNRGGDGKLTVAGKSTQSFQMPTLEDQDSLKLEVIDKYVSNNEMARLLDSHQYLILPYIGGTNSGFPLIALSRRCVPLVSSLPFFKEMEYINDSCYFDPDIEGIEKKLQEVLDKSSKAINADILMSNYWNYVVVFERELIQIYNIICAE